MMPASHRRMHGGFTLLELILVIGLLGFLSVMTLPNLLTRIHYESLPSSVSRLRSLIYMTRAMAMTNSLRYRIRFPEEGEAAELDVDWRQPIAEREPDPIEEPDLWEIVEEDWAITEPLHRNVWCVQMLLGKPDYEDSFERAIEENKDDEEKPEFEETEDLMELQYPPVVFQTDGTSQWSRFLLTNAPVDTPDEELIDYPQLQVLLDGRIGLAWLQRPLVESELELLFELEAPPILRIDRMTEERLTREKIIEIREADIRRRSR